MRVKLTRYEIMVLYEHYSGAKGLPTYQRKFLDSLSESKLWDLYIKMFSKQREKDQKELDTSSNNLL